MEKFEEKVYDLPKRSKSSFAHYVEDRMPDLVKEKPGVPIKD